MDDFEQWVTLLLLDAMQRAGHFKTVGESVTAAALKQKVHRSYVRFIDEALSALCRAGTFHSSSPLHCILTHHSICARKCMSYNEDMPLSENKLLKINVSKNSSCLPIL